MCCSESPQAVEVHSLGKQVTVGIRVLLWAHSSGDMDDVVAGVLKGKRHDPIPVAL